MTRPVEKECIAMQTVLVMKATGSKTSSTERAKKSGPMDKTMRANIAKDVSTVKVYFASKTKAITRESSFSTKSMEKVLLH